MHAKLYEFINSGISFLLNSQRLKFDYNIITYKWYLIYEYNSEVIIIFQRPKFVL